MSETPASPNLSIELPTIGDRIKKRVEWSPENESILVEWCDIAQCYKWLNSRAHRKYARLHTWFTIPAIILSTVSGTASFAQSSLTDTQKVYAPMVIGSINIFIGILTTIQQYLKISELNEAHRVSAIAWDKYARNIRIELAKAPDERMEAGVFLKHSRDEFDRLMETSPSIPESIIGDFMKTFSGKTESDPERKQLIKSRFAKLKKPDICDIIISAEENRHHWYKELEIAAGTIELTEFEARAEQDILKRQAELRVKEQELHDKELALKTRTENEYQEASRRVQAEETKIRAIKQSIENFITLFNATHGRRPLADEIDEHFKDTIEQTYMRTYIASYASDMV
jgi:hypothetical protein